MKRVKEKAVIGILALTVFVSPWAVALADDETEELEQQLESLRQQAEMQQEETERIQVGIDTVSAQIRQLSDEVRDAETAYRAVKRDLDAVDARIRDNQALLEKTTEDLENKTWRLRRRVRDIYMNGQVSYLDALFGVKDFKDFLTRMDLLSRVIRSDFRLVQQVVADKRVVEKARADLEAERKAQAKLTRAASDRQQVLRVKKQDKDRLLEKMETDKELSQQAYEEIVAASKEIEKLIQESRYHYPGGTAGAGGMIWPIEGEITSPFGWRVHPISGDARFHSGIDIGGDYGDPIHAAAAGQVIYSGWISGYGYAVILDHGGGISTLYGHNEALAVSEGQMVAQGQVIAYCGSTGNSTGPHCHFEVREGGEPVEPLGYL
ncbi:MAG: murein hydrolase activator EnvC family protein [Schwartzia sp. (in: firmicutes)]